MIARSQPDRRAELIGIFLFDASQLIRSAVTGSNVLSPARAHGTVGSDVNLRAFNLTVASAGVVRTA